MATPSFGDLKNLLILGKPQLGPQVLDMNGKVSGRVDAMAWQRFINYLATTTNSYLYDLTDTQPAGNGFNTCVRFDYPSISSINVAFEVALIITGSANQSYYRFNCASTVGSQAITLVNGTGTIAAGSGFCGSCRLVQNTTSHWLEFQTNLTLPSGYLALAAIYWMDVYPTYDTSAGVSQSPKPQVNWNTASSTTGANTITLSLNNTTNGYTFACVSTASAAQTNFV